MLHRRSPLSPCPEGTFRLAFVRLSRAIDLPASTTFSNEVPRALRRTNSLLVPVSISSRRAAAFFFAAVLRFGAALGVALRFGAALLFCTAFFFDAAWRLGPVLALGAVLRFVAVFFFRRHGASFRCVR